MDKFEKYLNKTINDRYIIKGLIGIGGMAYVLKAEDTLMNRTVAIKILNDDSNGDEKSVQRFVNESKAVAMLSHPNVVTIFDVTIEDDLKYIVMEYIDGVTLKDYLDKMGTLPWKEAVHYTSQILSGLEHAHSKGIIHRDIKPQNVMLLKDGKIKVMDFGIAKIPNTESITIDGKALGTVNYISPEQASGGEVGIHSDMYSVGVMLYEMVTGKLPFIAETPVAVAMMQVSNQPVSPRENNAQIPKGLEQIILKAMNKDPKARFVSCSAMRKALEYLKENPNTVFSERTPLPSEENEDNPGALTSEKKPKKKKGSFSYLPIISGATLAFFIVAIISATFLGLQLMKTEKNETGSDITIPDVIGKIYDSALESELDTKKCRVISVKYVTDINKKSGEIISQDPEANAKRRLSYNSEYYDVKLTVNKGAQDSLMQDYSLMYGQEAKLALEGKGFKVITKTQADDSVLKDYVITTVPAKGDLVTEGSTVTLYVSDGMEIKTTLMPEVVNLSLENAKKEILKANLSIGSITYQQSSVPVGYVIDCNRKVGEKLPQKISKIDLVVSSGGISNGEVQSSGTEENTPAADITLANYIGKDVNEVKAELEALGIKVITLPNTDSDAPVGAVISTNPKAGEDVFIGSTVTLNYKADKDANTAEMPKVDNMDLTSAKKALSNVGLELGNIIYLPSESSENKVIGASSKTGEKLKTGTKVDLYISDGNEPKKSTTGNIE